MNETGEGILLIIAILGITISSYSFYLIIAKGMDRYVMCAVGAFITAGALAFLGLWYCTIPIAIAIIIIAAFHSVSDIKKK